MHSWTDLVRAARTATTPAPGLRAVTLAQWILESGRGTSELAKRHANFAGLKWRDEMTGYATPISYGAHDGVDTYCAFASVDAFIAGYWRFIGRSVYSGWDAFAGDPRGYITFLKSRGYAGDAFYPEKVMALLQEAENLLADTGVVVVEEPERPSRSELTTSRLELMDAGEAPDFHTLGHVKHRYQGARPNGLEGAIVHYDAGRCRPTNGHDDLEWGARLTSEWGESQGYAYATISRSGRIYLPSNMDWLSWGSHAGKSKCPVTGRESVSQFYVGFEINCPGYIYPTDDPDIFIAWFDAKRNAQGSVVLNSHGHATIATSRPEIYRRAELRHIGSLHGNIRPGVYVPYTRAQQESLIKVLIWLKRRYPKTFRLDYVFGHDEVSPVRKVDPGGSYGVIGTPPGSEQTMAQLRSDLLHAWANVQAMV
ncbi:MAG: hypothetical protein CFE29_08975 [Bradyrhizobiaceae bacterium PARB1]|jgi:Mannosyl-glycoprotein endo-beta-N-acetylglucosaminidase/N-acetylmuramoyl-L-alanine amidase|nr:MAG: hypothetical protein CFE29_08975 [Bradyrhizobiaceae bacterium PARB1]